MCLKKAKCLECFAVLNTEEAEEFVQYVVDQKLGGPVGVPSGWKITAPYVGRNMEK